MDDMEKTDILANESASQEISNQEDFKPITSQEQFNAILKKRLKQQERVLTARFEEQQKTLTSEKAESLANDLSEYQELLAAAAAENDELRAYKQQQELREIKLKAAQDYKIPMSLLDNITGTSENEILQSAAVLADGLAANIRVVPPAFNPDPAPSGSAEDAAWRLFTRSLTNEYGEPL